MRVLGIDPGTVVMGYGVIEGDDKPQLVACGAIKCPARHKTPERLGYLYQELLKIISRHKPDVIAIETPFVAENVKSALAIGKAQAVAILAATTHKIPICEYPPAQVKQTVAGYGTSTKEQVQEMVRLQLHLNQAPQPTDAADALAVALCHIQASHLNSLLNQKIRGA
ncbi:MAG: crossover junction endodeoxyribonuclease RuvC [Chloroflexota bacterium]